MRAGRDLRGVERAAFGVTPDGADVESFLLRNTSGIEVCVLSLGGIIRSISAPDRRGTLADITPGYDTLEGYLADPRYYGALVGRVANRIAKSRFTLDGREYRLPSNDGANHLHGGPRGFHRAVWDVSPFQRSSCSGAVLTHRSAAGDQGYPGTLDVRLSYTLTDDNALVLDYAATTDEPTLVSLTQHTYFNLAGHDAGSALMHALTLHAHQYLPVDESLIPTGELRAVGGTLFDFNVPRAIGDGIGARDEQLMRGRGYDHNWVVDRTTVAPGDLAAAARLVDVVSGRTLDVATTEPGIQFYSGNDIAGGPIGKNGCIYGRHSAVALETQHFPDAANHLAFDSIVLRPGEGYRSRTVYGFGVIP